MSSYDGMTLNERLGTAGLFDAWDTAGRARDEARMVEILMSVDVLEGAARETVAIVLRDPGRYGL